MEDPAICCPAPELSVFPNPFTTQATIRTILPDGGPALLEIFNLNGQRVAALLSGEMDAGQHEYSWDGTDSRGRQLSAGVYMVRLRTEKGLTTRRLILAR